MTPPRTILAHCTIAKYVLVFTAMFFLPMAPLALADDLDDQEQVAMIAAVDRVASAVVRIETIGGQERVGRMVVGTGPTTGLVVDPAGYIISSAFNFISNPTSILVRLPDGTRKPARRIATDHSRMLVLLKVDVDSLSPLPWGEGPGVRALYDTVPLSEMRVGQWAIAVGRTFQSDQPNRSVGILSALNRVWGKAIQTDASVSPNNYGGPLIDIHGRVLGIIVPLSPEADDAVAGVEWYDSGVGFAVPLEHIHNVLPRLKNGEDLFPGRAGISLKGPNLYTSEPTVAACHPNGPAETAGLKPGDRIIEIDRRPVAHSADVKQEIGRRYAGQKMHVTVLRDKQRIETEITLAAKLDPVQEEVDEEEVGSG